MFETGGLRRLQGRRTPDCPSPVALYYGVSLAEVYDGFEAAVRPFVGCAVAHTSTKPPINTDRVEASG